MWVGRAGNCCIHFISKFLKPLTRYPVRWWRAHSVLWMGWVGVLGLCPAPPLCPRPRPAYHQMQPSSECLGCFVSSSWVCRAWSLWKLISGFFLPLWPWTDIWFYSGGKGPHMEHSRSSLLPAQTSNSHPSKAKSTNGVFGKFSLLSLLSVAWSKSGFVDQFPEFYFFLDLTVLYLGIKESVV